MVDLLQVEQVLLNLLRNAAEAMPAGGEITLAASTDGAGGVTVIMRDSGPGFPAEFVADKFPPLTSSKPEGLGVGLSLCRSIVEAHGGQLIIGGRSDGKPGAEARFTLSAA